MANQKYYVVEARIPVQVTDAESVKDAASIAARRIKSEYGTDVSNWFLRVFVYDGDNERVGPQEEWFSNPTGTSFREFSQNFDHHNDLIEKGEEP